MVWSNNSSLSAGLNPGVTEPRPAQQYGRVAQDHPGETSALDSDWATLSTAGSQAAQGTDESGVRDDKVATVRAALTAGTYMVPAAQVAQRAIGAMLGLGV
ncbi:flagellar biosynthesis anti-sigma factor FlgM [Terracidiphilus sp.]|jgi:anti-sigma28 factor (negative regulator of flagellin synthesis)|uniref:flagellar biosynthesis anti-sigma factor FlgM n=1 Tax=Terracidiphilus sp. TaxID=1964191 RepID=UPI003C210BE6